MFVLRRQLPGTPLKRTAQLNYFAIKQRDKGQRGYQLCHVPGRDNRYHASHPDPGEPVQAQIPRRVQRRVSAWRARLPPHFQKIIRPSMRNLKSAAPHYLSEHVGQLNDAHLKLKQGSQWDTGCRRGQVFVR